MSFGVKSDVLNVTHHNVMISNRLFEEIREKRGLVYSIGYSWRPYRLLSGGYATITFMPKFDQVTPRARVRACVRALVRGPGRGRACAYEGACCPLNPQSSALERGACH